jgi:decaprenyl-phosphate phosphoribosyltransferase
MSATATVVFYGLWAFDRAHNSVSWFAASMIPITIAVLRYAVDVDGGLASDLSVGRNLGFRGPKSGSARR